MPRETSAPERILQRLDWQVIRRLDGLLQGDYRSLFMGFGLDLADMREYQFGDDVRTIDWNVTARMVTPYVREFIEDREVTAWFLLDLSPSVDFGTVHTLKRNHLVDFVTVLARLLTRHGNRVGAIYYNGNNSRIIPAQGGKLQVLRMINDLIHQPRLKLAPMTDLSVLFENAIHYVKRRSLVFIVSDFISKPGWEKALGVLSQRHEVLAVRLIDPREIDMPDIGPIIIQDAETGEQLYVDTHDFRFRERFHQAAVKREFHILQVLRRSGVDVLQLNTEEDLVKSVLQFAAMRRQRKKQPAGSKHILSV